MACGREGVAYSGGLLVLIGPFAGDDLLDEILALRKALAIALVDDSTVIVRDGRETIFVLADVLAAHTTIRQEASQVATERGAGFANAGRNVGISSRGRSCLLGALQDLEPNQHVGRFGPAINDNRRGTIRRVELPLLFRSEFNHELFSRCGSYRSGIASFQYSLQFASQTETSAETTPNAANQRSRSKCQP
jgi:hypothetical protein